MNPSETKLKHRLICRFRITLPLVAVRLIATGILSFIFSWNDLLFGYVLTSNNVRIPVRFATESIGYTKVNRDLISSAGVVGIIIPVILIISIEKYLVKGFTFDILDEK